jgi:hypothetical protein
VRVASIRFPTDFLRGPQAIEKAIRDLVLVERAPAGDCIELGVFYSREPKSVLEPKLAKIGLPMFHIDFGNGENASIVVRQRIFESAQLGPFSTLAYPKGSVTLPPAKWSTKDLASGATRTGLSSLLFNKPANSGGVL